MKENPESFLIEINLPWGLLHHSAMERLLHLRITDDCEITDDSEFSVSPQEDVDTDAGPRAYSSYPGHLVQWMR